MNSDQLQIFRLDQGEKRNESRKTRIEWRERERVRQFLFLLNKIASSHQLVIVAEMFLNV